VSLVTTDDAFAGLASIEVQRTDEAMTFSGLVERRIEDVRAAPDPEAE